MLNSTTVSISGGLLVGLASESIWIGVLAWALLSFQDANSYLEACEDCDAQDAEEERHRNARD